MSIRDLLSGYLEPKESLFGYPQINENVTPEHIGVLGIPYDITSSFRSGARDAPNKIRHASSLHLISPITEYGVDISEIDVVDIGNVNLAGIFPEQALLDISDVSFKIFGYFRKAIFLGGDHFITYPILRGLSRVKNDFGLIVFDAHLDLYDLFEGQSLSHATTLRRIIDDDLVKPENILVIGVRNYALEEIQFAENYGVRIFETKYLNLWDTLNESLSLILSSLKNVYISIDMDVLDPAFAPGVGAPVPGGISTRELIHILSTISSRSNILGFDITEIVPAYDHSDITLLAASKIMMEIIGRL